METIIYLGRENMTEFLVKNGAKVNLADKSGRTTLHLATLKGISNEKCNYSSSDWG